jgi:hypothetical protein
MEIRVTRTDPRGTPENISNGDGIIPEIQTSDFRLVEQLQNQFT